MNEEAGVALHVHVERRSDWIGIEDMRAMFRLEGELGELSRDLEEQRRHALQGIVALVGAQVGVWGIFRGLKGEGGAIREAVHLGWGGERERELYVDYLDKGQDQWPDPCIPHVAKALDQPVGTFVRGQLMSHGAWYREEHVQRYRRAAGIDAFIHSVRVHGDAGYVISIHRAWGQRPFTERERRLLDLFHRESRALLPRAPALPPQLDKTLRALLRGLSEKQVAAELGLSPHTVHEYARTLYRRFGVTSRAELFAKILERR
ncbi:Transcriptional regulator, LuxR family protein [Minicystis rosea]|nr:Transcriptional regulator, LuxR family protein [Minicystis rosea]